MLWILSIHLRVQILIFKEENTPRRKWIKYPFYLSLASCFSPIPGSHSSSTPLLSHLKFLSTSIFCLSPSLVQASSQNTSTITSKLQTVVFLLASFTQSILIESVLSIICISNPINSVKPLPLFCHLNSQKKRKKPVNYLVWGTV